jgi:dTDP-4-amino-4,6-dideoxygalactose transaminase
MVVTNDAQRADNLARIRVHGSKPKYYHKVVGGNFRLDTLQAGIVSVKLKHLDNWTQARQRNAARYDKLLAASGLSVADSSHYSANGHEKNGKAPLLLPKTVANRHIFNQYVVRTPRRDALKTALQEKGVATEIYYPVPMHLQECFASLGYKQGDFPQSENAAKETLALPIYPELTDAQAQHVTQVIRDFFAA